ncbi:MAG TPA: ChbG/HpnK family deacetylase [Ohtaekwangia sp.]|uniref:ChbG/HpnK family deacetylase n=1 Tax=Ohtaekwangia sp. TaxID=2066019 RepID=UPI002F93C1F7
MTHFRNTLVLFLLAIQVFAQTTSLPRSSTPEAEDVSSQAIINFLDAAAKTNHEFHSIMILRHGKVVAEGWWNPYRADLKHTLYSVSKSFTATAVGFAVAENKLSVEDKVISFFPEDAPVEISPYLADLRIKHLLSMSVGQATDPTGDVNREENWVRKFLSIPIAYEPGTKFLYNSAATYTLSAIVQKVTGQRIADYLKPRLFDPLGITGIDWETDAKGINTGGWGLRLKTEDMAKFGQLFLQKGQWQGKQILPATWIEEASTAKIDQDPAAPQVKKDSSDWLQGYCYQMWRSRHNSYRADGAFGQYILVLPEHDAVIAVTSESSSMQNELNLVWKYILSAFSKEKLSANAKKAKELKARLAALALPLPAGKTNAAQEAAVTGKTFGIISSDRRLESFRLDFRNGVCQLTLNTDSATHAFQFTPGKWEKAETDKFGPYLVARAKHNRVGLSPFKIAESYRWADDKTLELTLRYIESPHTETIRCTFDGEYASLDFENSFNKSIALHLKGVEKKPVANAPKLIIRGDDMGFSHSANEALIKSYRQGIETSIEVIVPSPWFPETVKILNRNPRVDVGLHFAITSEWDNVKWRPLTDCPSLRNADGYFYPMIFKNRNYPGQAVVDNPWKLEDIEKELRAQIVMARKYIPQVSHISGHMMSTAFTPEVKALAQRLAKEYNLPMVDVDAEKTLAISYTGFDMRNKTTEQRIRAFIDMLDKLEAGKTYVFVEHPGIDNDELRAIYHIGYEDVAQGRQDVTTIFTSEKVKEAIIRKGIALVSYEDVLSAKK